MSGACKVPADASARAQVADELWVVNRGKGGKPGSVDVWHSSFEEYKAKLENEYKSKMVSNNTVKGMK